MKILIFLVIIVYSIYKEFKKAEIRKREEAEILAQERDERNDQTDMMEEEEEEDEDYEVEEQEVYETRDERPKQPTSQQSRQVTDARTAAERMLEDLLRGKVLDQSNPKVEQKHETLAEQLERRKVETGMAAKMGTSSPKNVDEYKPQFEEGARVSADIMVEEGEERAEKQVTYSSGKLGKEDLRKAVVYDAIFHRPEF